MLALHRLPLALKPQIDATVGEGVQHPLGTQHLDGSWGLHERFVGEQPGLTVYPLLKCGDRPVHPRAQRSLLHLGSIEPEHTDATACSMLAYSATGDRGRRERIASLPRRLLDSQKPVGDYGYPQAVPDLLNTQYAALGLWDAHKSEASVPAGAGRKLIGGTLNYRESVDVMQVPEEEKEERASTAKATGAGALPVGGFGHRRGVAPTGSMATAGNSCLRIVEVEYFDGETLLAEPAGDPTKAWRTHRCPALAFGSHALRVRVTLLAAGSGPGDAEPATEVVESPPMQVEIRCNGDRTGERVRLGADPIALIEYALPDVRRIKRVQIVILERERRTGSAGFASVSLLGPPEDER